MYIYNTLTNQKEKFTPLEPNKVKMYVCGPTVYNHIHIGNARPVIFFDVVRRYFEYLGFDVTYVSNITDVDDKIIQQAQNENIPESDITSKYTEAYLRELTRLNVKPYNHMPRVTQNMDRIIAFIERLIEVGYAYESEGDVYFRVTKLKDYGRLSNQETEHLEVGARITEHNKKENPLDFTLWKRTDLGIKWPSPWGNGRPGWHTECVTMIHDGLGDIIDIHGGGSDLKFPHHENELAQSEALAHTTLANYWMHNGRLMIDDEKMSKSLGNFILLKDFLDQFDAKVLRYFMISTHYRQPINYTLDSIQQVEKEIQKIDTSYRTLQQKLDFYGGMDLDGPLTNFLDEVLKEFEETMSDDFNTSNAITVLQKLLKEINKKVRKSDFTQDELIEMKAYYKVLNIILYTLGLEISIANLTNEDKKLIRKKDEARSKKDFSTADTYRQELQQKGIII